jgi:hypothetical protein
MDGREKYLESLDTRWPEVLAALHRDVYPSYVAPADASARLRPFLDPYERIRQDGSLAVLNERLMYWADHHHIRDEWLLDAAMTTMAWASQMERVTNAWDAWLYMDDTVPVFRPHLDSEIWRPPEKGGRESWEEFSSRIISDLTGQVNRYRSLVSARYGVASTQTSTHAGWTVRFQKGDSFRDIARHLPRAHRDPEQTVSKAVRRFANGIGLTLRTRR